MPAQETGVLVQVVEVVKERKTKDRKGVLDPGNERREKKKQDKGRKGKQRWMEGRETYVK